MRRFLLATASLMLLATTALAAPPPAPPVSDWVPDETIVVAAKAAGPAFWHIKKGDSEIYILGMIGEMPKGTAWNTVHASEIIKGARVVLTPPVASSGFFSTTWFLLWNRDLLRMPDGKTLAAAVPPALWSRFASVVKTLDGPKLDSFDDDPPIVAAMKLEGGFTTKYKLSAEEPVATVAKIARANRVPVERIADYDALGLVKEILRLPLDAQQVCLKEAVGDVEQRIVHVGPASRAWADGDVKAIKAHYTPHVFFECAKATASFNRLYDRAVADYLKAIEEALAKPGKTVLVTDVGSLLRNTGVVEKLHAQGVIIEGPAE